MVPLHDIEFARQATGHGVVAAQSGEGDAAHADFLHCGFSNLAPCGQGQQLEAEANAEEWSIAGHHPFADRGDFIGKPGVGPGLPDIMAPPMTRRKS